MDHLLSKEKVKLDSLSSNGTNTHLFRFSNLSVGDEVICLVLRD